MLALEVALKFLFFTVSINLLVGEKSHGDHDS
jgi:hypothetical protein